MTHDSGPREAAARSRRTAMLAGGLIVVAALCAYRGSFRVPFVYDDEGSIIDNQSIRSLWTALTPPPGGMPVSGRPVLNLSFALNYALGGLDVRGYHVVNLAIHMLAGLTLFGIVRRTLKGGPFDSAQGIRREGPAMSKPRQGRVEWLALAVALIWTLHPLQTESVVYISQRAESLMGLFYLLTLYCFIRYADETGDKRREVEGGRIQASPPASSLPAPASRWAWLSVLACFFGMATKEVMVSAPLIVLLYDRTFAAGTFREAWRLRRKYYLGLACTWLVLIYLVLGAGNRGGTAGIASGVTPGAYALIQFQAIVHYLRLAIWPHPLIFYYGRPLGVAAATIGVDAAIVIGLVAATIYALCPASRDEGGRGGKALGFAGAWFFMILAPSSSVVTLGTEVIAEHRMYLPLAAVVVAVVCGAYAVIGRAGPCFLLCLVAALGLGFTTDRRVGDYRSDLALWSDTAQKEPDNSIVRGNLGFALLEAGNVSAALQQCTEALRLNPDNARAHSILADALVQSGRLSEAIVQYREAARLKPGLFETHNNLGNALRRTGRLPEAISEYGEALRLNSGISETHNNLGIALARSGRMAEAITQFQEAVRLDPRLFETHFNLGRALAAAGRLPEARTQFEEALEIRPGDPQARDTLTRLNNRQQGP